MTAARFYSSTSGSMELQADITDTSTTIQVDSTVGLPGTTPFTLVIDPGSTEEIVDCTGVAGTSLTVTRGVDGSPAQTHVAGAIVRHMATARDFRDAQEHIGSTAAHGTTGPVVGTTDAQALTNKDLTSGTNTFPSSLATDAELTAHTSATVAHGATGAVVGTTSVQALTNKDLTDPTNSFPTSLATDAQLSAHAAASSGVHGVSGNVVGENNTQTLTNKTVLAVPTASNGNALVLTGLSGQTGALAVWKDSAGTVLGSIHNDGAFSNTASNVGCLFLGSESVVTSYQAYIGGGDPTKYVLNLNAPAGQTFDILRMAVNGSRVAGIRADGTLDATNIPSSVAGTSTTKAKKRLHWGTFSGTTDSNGYLVVTHGAGFTPVMAQVELDTALQHAVDSKTSTTFRVRVVASDGTNLGFSEAISGSFICGE